MMLYVFAEGSQVEVDQAPAVVLDVSLYPLRYQVGYWHDSVWQTAWLPASQVKACERAADVKVGFK
jgi:hypothetical protein